MRRSPATDLRGVRAVALVVAFSVGGCSLLSLDELQSGASTSGSSESVTSTTGGPSSSSGSAGSTSASAGGASSSASASSSGTGGAMGAGDDAYVAAILADGPMAWYRLAEASAGDAVIDQIAMKNGAYSGSVMLGAQPPFMNTTDTAARFIDGEVVILHPELAIYDAAHSLEAWIDVETVDNSHRGIIDVEWADGATDKQGYRMYVYTSVGTPKLVYGRVNALGDQDLSVNYPNDGQYHHVVGTYDGATGLCVYIDGAATCTVQAKIPLTNAATNVVIGARTFGGSTTTFHGTIDEVTLWDKALTAAQVTAHFEARNAP